MAQVKWKLVVETHLFVSSGLTQTVITLFLCKKSVARVLLGVQTR